MSTLVNIDTDNSSSEEPILVLAEAKALYSEMVANRRWFHAHAELSFKEFITAAKVVEILKSYGILEIFENVGQTGVVALIRGGKPGPCIALRADMDALPLTETAQVEYKSQNEGVMHACGHDGHMTMLLATAKILYAERESLAGVVKLVFQPAEEGYGGAREMIKDGVLEDGFQGPKVDYIYGLHQWAYRRLGDVSCEIGPILAASDKFSIDVLGVGGHGAVPQGTVDAIVEAAALVSAFQTVISRNKDPLEHGVVTCGTISGGSGYNIIADKVTICGTCRSFTPATQELIKSRMGDICCGVAKTFGGEINMEYTYGYPPTVNNSPECNAVVVKAATALVGEHRASFPQRSMGAEDFSYFLQQRPGCFFFVGSGHPGPLRPHHKSVFDFDERAMMIGASIFVQIVRSYAQEQ